MSSFYSTILIKGLSGSTGPTGATGSLGPVGPTGPNVYGSTGSSIIGITLDSIKQLLFTFENGSTTTSSPIVSGATGSWQARISGQGTNTIFSSSVQGSTGDFIVLKNFKTDTPESIGITVSDDQNSIVINYISTLGVTFDQSELNRLVIGSGTGISSANITNYDTLTKSLDIKIDRYLEGITNVYPIDISGSNTSQWNLDTDLYSIFNLQPETTINADKIINVNSTTKNDISRGITIIIPSGITAAAKNISFIVNDDNDVLFPMTLSIKLTDKLEVVNMISMGADKWYGSFVLWNNESNININAKTPVFDLLNTGDPVDFGPWKTAESAMPSCTTQPNSDMYERPCIDGDSSSGGGGGGGGGGGNACLLSRKFSQVAHTVVRQDVDTSIVTNPRMRDRLSLLTNPPNGGFTYPWKIKDSATGMDMVLIPGGTFMMGAVPGQTGSATEDERPQHEVLITLPFYMSIHEVTQSVWTRNTHNRPNNSFYKGDSLPVENLTKFELLDFVNDYPGVDIPTEAEWEYAARAGYDNQINYFTITNLNDNAWYIANSSNKTHDVGGKLANGLGLYDMIGNVFEYTYRCPEYTVENVWKDPVDPFCCKIVNSYNCDGISRGGSFSGDNITTTLNSSNRAFSFFRGTNDSRRNGFRVIRRCMPE